MPRAARKPPRRDGGRPRGAPIAAAVLARTLDEVAAHGLAGLSIARIARAAEVNKTSVYRRWPTRGALVAAALEHVLDDLGRDLPDTGSLRTDLRAMAAGIAALLRQPLGRELARAAFTADAGPELAALAARRLAAGAVSQAGEMLRRARARGELRKDIDATLLLDLIAGSALHRAMLVGAPLSKAWVQSMVDVVVAGVAPPPAARARPRPPARRRA